VFAGLRHRRRAYIIQTLGNFGNGLASKMVLGCMCIHEIVNINDRLGLIIMCILKTFRFFMRNRCYPFLNVINVIGNMRFFCIPNKNGIKSKFKGIIFEYILHTKEDNSVSPM